MGQTVEKLQELSGKICPREVPRNISLITQGTSRGKISRQLLRLFNCLSDLRLQKPKKMCPPGVVWTYSGLQKPESDSVNSRLRFLITEVCTMMWGAWCLEWCKTRCNQCFPDVTASSALHCTVVVTTEGNMLYCCIHYAYKKAIIGHSAATEGAPHSFDCQILFNLSKRGGMNRACQPK